MWYCQLQQKMFYAIASRTRMPTLARSCFRLETPTRTRTSLINRQFRAGRRNSTFKAFRFCVKNFTKSARNWRQKPTPPPNQGRKTFNASTSKARRKTFRRPTSWRRHPRHRRRRRSRRSRSFLSSWLWSSCPLESPFLSFYILSLKGIWTIDIVPDFCPSPL